MEVSSLRHEMETSVLRRAMDQWFSDLSLTPIVRGEFADSAMLKIAGRQGLGLFAIPVSIQDDVTAIYGLREVGVAEGVKERFYAVSVECKTQASSGRRHSRTCYITPSRVQCRATHIDELRSCFKGERSAFDPPVFSTRRSNIIKLSPPCHGAIVDCQGGRAETHSRCWSTCNHLDAYASGAGKDEQRD